MIWAARNDLAFESIFYIELCDARKVIVGCASILMNADMLKGECNVGRNIVSVLLDGPDNVPMNYRRFDALVEFRRFTKGHNVVAADKYLS